MDDLIAWLLAAIDEDEQALVAPHRLSNEWCDDGAHWPADRVRAECEAKRKLLSLHKHETIPENRREAGDEATFGCISCHLDHDYEQTWGGGWCDHVRIMAEPYAKLGRPGYREEEWAL